MPALRLCARPMTVQPVAAGLVITRACLLAATVLMMPGCGGANTASAPSSPPVESSPTESPFARAVAKIGVQPSDSQANSESAADPSTCSQFVDVAADLGITHIYNPGMVGQNLMVEATGGGCGWLDYDADGHWDLYLNQGGDPVNLSPVDSPQDQLYRNNGESFVLVTQAARLHEFRYGQGVAVGDFDGDGFDDIYLTNVGQNTLLHNCGDGTFEDVTEASKTGDKRWSSSAAWADLDGDGLVDLYVCNYCDYDPANPMPCIRDGKPRICHPKNVPPVPDEFYRNLGDGTFAAEASSMGLVGPQNRGLGVVAADFDQDGDIDVYVANDTTANFLFDNQGDGTFQEVASLRGCAVNRNGATQASMGLACGDFDGDGLLDLYSTHFYRESNTLYRNLGKIGFEDVTGSTRLHGPTNLMLGFGTVMADFNYDAQQELFVANGHIDPNKSMEGQVYEMPAQLFQFDGSRWRDCSAVAGDYFKRKLVGRGVADCDYDNDGDLDLCVVNQNTPAALLENRSAKGHWLRLRPIGIRSNRRAVGTRVTVRSNGVERVAELFGGGSYAASGQPFLTFGLGKEDAPCTVEIRWPTGDVETLQNVPVDQLLVRHEPISRAAL